MRDDERGSVALRGHLDRVTEEGIVEGWCWDPKDPDRRVNVAICVDGTPAGTSFAAQFRADLKEAGIGDGRHFFKFVLPWGILGARRSVEVSLRSADTGESIDQPIIFYQRAVASVDDRIAELEGQVRLLQTRLGEVSRHQAQESVADTSALFETVGSFFLDLARQASEGIAQSSSSRLGSLIGTMIAGYKPLVLPAAAHPSMTLCVDGSAPLRDVYECIAAMNLGDRSGRIELVLLDTGAYEDVALLPLIVRNLRYIRSQADVSVERNAIAQAAGTEYVGFVKGTALITGDWVGEMLRAFDENPGVAAVGSRVELGEGTRIHGGYVFNEDGRLEDLKGSEAAGYGIEPIRDVHGFNDCAVAFRTSMLLGSGAFDPALGDPDTAMFDLCLRLREGGWRVVHHPLARVCSMAMEDGSRSAADTLKRLRHVVDARWQSRVRSLLECERKPKG